MKRRSKVESDIALAALYEENRGNTDGPRNGTIRPEAAALRKPCRLSCSKPVGTNGPLGDGRRSGGLCVPVSAQGNGKPVRSKEPVRPPIHAQEESPGESPHSPGFILQKKDDTPVGAPQPQVPFPETTPNTPGNALQGFAVECQRSGCSEPSPRAS